MENLEDELKKAQIEKFRRESEKLEAEKEKIRKEQQIAERHDQMPFYKKPTFLQNIITVLVSFTFLGFYINTIVIPMSETKNIALARENAVASKRLDMAKDSLESVKDSIHVLKEDIDTLYRTYEIQYRALDSLKGAYLTLTEKSIKEKEDLIRQNEKKLTQLSQQLDAGSSQVVKLRQETDALKQSTATAAASVRLVKNSLAVFGPLNHYKIDIFCSNVDQDKGLSIKRKLLAVGFQGIVDVKVKTQSFFDRLSAPNAYEVRYEPPTEKEFADRLVGILNTHMTGITFQTRTVGTRTPSYLSIFVPATARTSM